MEQTIPRNSWKKQSRDILSKQVKMVTFNGSEAAAGNDELYLASQVGDHDSIYIFMQQNMSTSEYSSAGWHDIEVQA